MASKYRTIAAPSFFTKESLPRADQIWMMPYEQRFLEALAWKEKWGIDSAAVDKPKVAVVGIDFQVTFVQAMAQLTVGGAVEDCTRFCEFIYRHLPIITRIFMTLDTHTAWQIFHRCMLVDQDGNPPPACVPISDAEIQAGKWRINPEAAYAIFGDSNKYAELMQYLPHYSSQLAQAHETLPDDLKALTKYGLTPWPFHAMLGGVCHALQPIVEEACFFHNICRGSQTQFAIKGGLPLAEAFSPYGEEVRVDHRGRPVGQKNVDLFNTLNTHQVVIVAGEAKSHCERAFITDHLLMVAEKDPELAKRVYLLEDCTSPVVIPGVVDYTSEADQAFELFRSKGMNVVQSTTPMTEWPGLQNVLVP